MESIFTKVKRSFAQGNLLTRLLYINVGVFLVLGLLIVLATLFQWPDSHLMQWFQLPSSLRLLIYRPWTVITYMFLHIDFLHILFNMLWLYWFGQIFLLFFSERQLGGLYLLGGIAGAAMFLAAYHIFPYFRNVADSTFLMGASASVMAIVFAVSFYQKQYEINLIFLGRIKLIYLAAGVLIIDLLSMASDNAGGHIAHIGGALFGILFANRYRNGRDWTKGINSLIDNIVNLTKRKPRIKVMPGGRRPETDMEYNARKHEKMKDLDNILDKL